MKIVLVGQPNVGKTHLANALTGAHFKVANFTGITLRQNTGWVDHAGQRLTVVDLPGLYNLSACTPEEEITRSVLDAGDYDLVLNVVNAAQLPKNLPLSFQLLDLNRPLVLVVNMMDEWPAAEPRPDFQQMSALLGVPVLPVSAVSGEGLDLLRETLLTAAPTCPPAACGSACAGCASRPPLPFAAVSGIPLAPPPAPVYERLIEEAIEPLSEKILQDRELAPTPAAARVVALRLLEDDRSAYGRILSKPVFVDLHDLLRESRQRLADLSGHRNAAQAIAAARASLARGVMAQTGGSNLQHTPSERLDRLLLHPLWGLPVLLLAIWCLFQATFHVGEEAAALIREGFDVLSTLLQSSLPVHPASRALAEGAIPAIGTVLSFLPNILVLFLGINLLEQSGYMARAAYLLDGVMKRFGLHGRAFIPLITGFGCSVPAYLAAHTLRSPRDRLLTLLVIGFFSCSARLPVYVLFVSAFFPPMQAGNVLFAIYASGPLLALGVAKMLRFSILRGPAEPFVMELPRYRLPALRPLCLDLILKARIFIRRAGVNIGLISLLIWFLGSFPVADPTVQVSPSTRLEHSYLGQIGQVIQPVFAPLGFEWKLSISILGALAAKEAAVGTLATLYQIGEGGEGGEGGGEAPPLDLSARLRDSVDFKTGIAFILIIMTYSPCIAAMSAFFGQVAFWKWRLFYLIYPNLFAWLLAFAAYRSLQALGF